MLPLLPRPPDFPPLLDGLGEGLAVQAGVLDGEADGLADGVLDGLKGYTNTELVSVTVTVVSGQEYVPGVKVSQSVTDAVGDTVSVVMTVTVVAGTV